MIVIFLGTHASAGDFKCTPKRHYEIRWTTQHQVPKHEGWKLETLIEFVRILNQLGIPIEAKQLKKINSGLIETISFELTGTRSDGDHIIQQGIRHGGNWNQVLLLSRTGWGDPNQKRTKWTKQLIIYLIKYLHQKNIPLNFKAIKVSDPNDPGCQTLSAHLGKQVSLYSLHQAAVSHSYFGSWDAALRAAGLDPNEIQVQMNWSRESIILAIQHLHQNDVPLNFKAMRVRDLNDPGCQILSAHLGKPVSLFALFGSAVLHRYFGSWDAALRAAGLDPNEIQVQMNWSRESIILAIQHLHQNDVPLNSKAMRVRDLNDPGCQTLSDHLGKPVSLFALYGTAITHGYFGSWDAALRAAGLDPNEIRPQINWSRESIILAIQHLHQNDVQLNSNAMRVSELNDSGSQILSAHLGKTVSLYALYGTAITHGYFGSWDDALRAAGLDPDEIRLLESPVNCANRVVTVPHQEEVLVDSEGVGRLARLVGRSAPQAVNILIAAERRTAYRQAFSRLTETLPPDQAILLTQLLDILSQNTQRDLSQVISEFEDEFDIEQVNALLATIRSNSDLRSLYQDIE